MHKKKFISKTSLTKLSKSENSAYFLHVFANNFFSKLFQWILNQREVLHFYTHIEYIKKFWLLLALFVNFNCKCARNGSKKRKNLFYECVLEFK
jgi:hypothetical protein